MWVIEKRTPDGSLDFSAPQPEQTFGMAAITGITEDAMAKIIFRADAEVVLTGDSIAVWPATIDPRFIAREKTW